MTLALTNVLAALAQVGIFAIIPLLWYLVGHRTLRGFLHWAGLKRAPIRVVGLSVTVQLIVVATSMFAAGRSPTLTALLTDEHTPGGHLRALPMGLAATIWVISEAWIKTALSEELFFRGFLARRLIAKFGVAGNLGHAAIFGSVHLLAFVLVPAESRSLPLLFFVVVNPALGAFIWAWVNEKYANGSILPGWACHATANTISYFWAAYVLSSE